MSPREAVQAAEKTRALGGRSIRAISMSFVIVAIALAQLGVSLGFELAFDASPGVSLAVGGAFLIAAVVVIVRVIQRVVARNNAALVELQRDRVEAAREVFRSIATHIAGRGTVAIALHNLASIACNEGDFDEAVTLSYASVALTAEGSDARDVTREQLAFTLACAGRCRESESVLAVIDSSRVGAAVKARVELTRALIAYRDGAYEQATNVLRASRTLLRSSLSGLCAAMTDAVEASAVAQLAGGYRGGAAAPSGLSYRPRVRAVVAKVIPGAEGLL